MFFSDTDTCYSIIFTSKAWGVLTIQGFPQIPNGNSRRMIRKIKNNSA